MSTWNSDQHGFNKGGMIAFVFSMVFTIGFFIYVSFIHTGVDLKEVALEEPAAAAAAADSPAVAGDAAAPAATASSAPKAPQKISDLSTVTEPWVETPALIEHGHAVYNTACVACHGEDYKGSGPAAASLQPPPRDLVEGKWKYGGDPISLYQTITSGVKGTSMAGFAHLAPQERWALVHFLRSITENKVPIDEAELKAKAASLN